MSIFSGFGSIAIITYPLPIGCRLKPLIMVIWMGLVRVLSPGLSDVAIDSIESIAIEYRLIELTTIHRLVDHRCGVARRRSP
jgi:hypothetical protein